MKKLISVLLAAFLTVACVLPASASILPFADGAVITLNSGLRMTGKTYSDERELVVSDGTISVSEDILYPVLSGYPRSDVQSLINRMISEFYLDSPDPEALPYTGSFTVLGTAFYSVSGCVLSLISVQSYGNWMPEPHVRLRTLNLDLRSGEVYEAERMLTDGLDSLYEQPGESGQIFPTADDICFADDMRGQVSLTPDGIRIYTTAQPGKYIDVLYYEFPYDQLNVSSRLWKAINTDYDPELPMPPAEEAVAVPAASSVLVDGKRVAFDAYLINGQHYFKLRDVAYVLTDTRVQFDAEFKDGVIHLFSGRPYRPDGSEMKGKGAGNHDVRLGSVPILLDGGQIELTAYPIEGYNYFQLAELGAAFGFKLGWSYVTQTVTIDTISE